jgi:hypothetical protein
MADIDDHRIDVRFVPEAVIGLRFATRLKRTGNQTG